MATMQRLPDETMRLIRSGTAITDIGDIAMALLDNSIDAGATRFRFEMSLDQFSVAAKDNGCGIPGASMDVLGQRYFTSKNYQGWDRRHKLLLGKKTIGYRGEALASISQIGIVDIISRDSESKRAFRCTVRNEKRIFGGSCALDLLDGYNTVVRVTNIFASHPVRQRIVGETAKRVADDIRFKLQVRSLGCPEIAIQLVKSTENTVVFSYNSTLSLNQRVSQIYGPSIAHGLDFIALDYDDYRLYGSMSRTPILNRIQHIFADGYVWDSPELIGIIRSVLTMSDYTNKTNTIGNLESSTRSRALHPMFILTITRRCAKDTLSSRIDHRTRRDSFEVTAEIKHLVVVACIKFLRKLGLMDDSQIRSAMLLVSGPKQFGTKRRFECTPEGIHANSERLDTGGKRQDALPSVLSTGSMHCTNSRFPIRTSSQLPRQNNCKSSCAFPGSFGTRVRREIPFAGAMNSSDSGMPIDIAALQVIGQADQKFIMCREPAIWLVAIDQHAADERVRLEINYSKLSHTLGAISRLPLAHPASMADGISLLIPPVLVALSKHNYDVVMGLQERLRLLGIQLATPEMAEPGGLVRHSDTAVHITCVPTVLAPRLRSSGQGGDGFAKEFLVAAAGWCLEHHAAPNTCPMSLQREAEANLDNAWPALVSVPGIFLDTLKSISCRGAVKFNESLDLGECRAIVEQLAACKFPEFCAHG
ncbi:DNA mismatch repair protein, partial [Kickxella alabastrina]